jgi:hypothetical protein
MIGWFKERRARRRLAAVVGRLPRQLGQDYGFGRHYTIGQVRTAAKIVKIPEPIHAYACAACCSQVEFAKLPSTHTYFELRLELFKLFEIAVIDFDCTHLIRLKIKSSGSVSGTEHDGSYGDT